jgi:RHS repeat-associated protein
LWTYAYNNGNEQTSMTLNNGTPETRTYDDWGRLSGRAQGTYSATYGYRYGGKTYSVASNFPNEANVTMNYRGDGRLYQRTQGSTTKTYRYDNRWNAILEETGTSTNGYIYVPGSAQELLGKTYGTLSATFAAYTYKDNIGSVRRWRLYNKSSLQNIEFEPYGGIYSADNTTTPYDPIFALHPYDPAAQMYRAPYRMYDSDSARWTRRDPLGMVDGPNVYAYVRGGVVGRWDPDGREYDGSGINPYPKSGGLGDEPGDASGSVLCAIGIGLYAISNDDDPKRVGHGGDHGQHCFVACRIQQVCGGSSGYLAAWGAEVLEGKDNYDEADVEAGNVGAKLGESCVNCDRACADKFPDSYPRGF